MKLAKVFTWVLVIGAVAVTYDQLARRNYVPKLFTKKVTKPTTTNPAVTNTGSAFKPLTVLRPQAQAPATTQSQDR